MEVYCKDCKNHMVWENKGSRIHVCKRDVYTDQIGEKYCLDREYCIKTNKDYDCKDFIPKWYKKRKLKK